MNFLTNLDLSQNQLLNAVLQPLAVSPANAKIGQIYYNTTDKAIYVFTGSGWTKGVGKIEIDLSEYYTKEQIDAGFYTKEDINQMIGDGAGIGLQVVEQLPSTGASNIIYLVPSENDRELNTYDEYLWTGDAFERVGDTSIDLSDYVTKEELSGMGIAAQYIMTLSAGATTKTSPTLSGSFNTLSAYNKYNHEALIVGYTVDQHEGDFTVTVDIQKEFISDIEIIITYMR